MLRIFTVISVLKTGICVQRGKHIMHTTRLCRARGRSVRTRSERRVRGIVGKKYIFEPSRCDSDKWRQPLYRRGLFFFFFCSNFFLSFYIFLVSSSYFTLFLFLFVPPSLALTRPHCLAEFARWRLNLWWKI